MWRIKETLSTFHSDWWTIVIYHSINAADVAIEIFGNNITDSISDGEEHILYSLWFPFAEFLGYYRIFNTDINRRLYK